MRLLCMLSALALLGGCHHKSSSTDGSNSTGQLDDDLAAPTTTAFRFDGADWRTASRGPGQLEAFDPKKTGWADRLELGTTESFGLPPLPDGPAPVLHLPALSATEGLELTPNVPANGHFASRGQVSRYTLVFDVYFPPASDGKFRALYQTDGENDSDAELFVSDAGGLGVGGAYQGVVDAGRWHRLVVVVRADGGPGQLQKYVDGVFVGAEGEGNLPIDDRFSIGRSLLLFTDDDGETGELFVSSVAFFAEGLLMDEVLALGGPTASGAAAIGSPGAGWPTRLPRRADAFGHKGDACCAPENTLASLNQAFDKGAAVVEVDIQLSRDGVAMVIHDDTVDRTTDGSGDVSDFTAAELQTLDAGRWFHPKFAGERIPTLAQAIAAAKGRGRIYVDGASEKTADAVAAALAEAGGAPDDLWPWAENGGDAAVLHQTLPDTPLLYGLSRGWEVPGFFESLASQGVTGFSLPWTELTPEFAAAAHAHGFYVEVYTLFDRDHMREVVVNGADGMETDYPGVLLDMEPSGRVGAFTRASR